LYLNIVILRLCFAYNCCTVHYELLNKHCDDDDDDDDDICSTKYHIFANNGCKVEVAKRGVEEPVST